VLPSVEELAIDANAAEMRRASKWLEAHCGERGVPQNSIDQLQLALDEVLANVINHGGAAPEPILLRLEFVLGQEGSATVTVSDACKPFDPLSAPRRVMPKTLEEATSGGMGLELIRKCSSVLHYRYGEGRNHLTFGTRWRLP
jgi:serine/threonine-protein kinase RsbW